ncbi:hypothetical protein J2W54_004479 [Rhodococcus fascians]|uniref:Uncharacterized protein n=2 Tax=root TaxID=1 RepID=A0A143QGI2_RHOFA|nr:hypothetical protein A3Q41_00548 [Rhodococcus fascians]AMY54149.1 hypothetical protein A3L23_02812 [Rhodococcus fascians D188]KJV04557.1 hypothetical protein VF34_00214 [Rhodococcus sp. PML026]MDP9638659.1 hypothetical protein [Rhodococcus cercidiphylli]MDR6912360.1 hypothetical protein [Rhodococcus sp. 3258]
MSRAITAPVRGRAKRAATRPVVRRESIATARLIPKRGTATPIELQYPYKTALENNR